jgi:hypothetical protein
MLLLANDAWQMMHPKNQDIAYDRSKRGANVPI